MLEIQTFDARRGGNVLYKALAHPLAAEAVASLAKQLGAKGDLAVFDPGGVATALYALHPEMPRPTGYFVQGVEALWQTLAGVRAQPLPEIAGSQAATLLIAGFDTARLEQQLVKLIPVGMTVVSLDAAKLPTAMLTSSTYLEKLNFATNYAFFREQDGLSTRLVSANYWHGYGARDVRLWLRLFAANGDVLATWEKALGPGPGAYRIDSQEVRERFCLPEFAGQLFLHAIGVAGHDVLKYALDVYSKPGSRATALSATHDANAWPSERYAGLPAPADGDEVLLWVQNSHAASIPPNAITLNRMGFEEPVPLGLEIGPFASLAVDVAKLLPDVKWPAQIEVRAGRHVVRPRYEVRRAGHSHIAHVNVERADLRPDPGIATLHNLLGRGYLLPFPILPVAHYRSIVQPNPMAESQLSLPIRLDVFAEDGKLVVEHFLGNLPRNHNLAVELSAFGVEVGHAELVYDFRQGGQADGWLHGLFRYEDRVSGHVADTSFGAHIFNTIMTYRDEPQSYSGPPPGLSTRLFLKLGHAHLQSYAVLIYPASSQWQPNSSTLLELLDGTGTIVSSSALAIACHGSAMIWPHIVFGEEALLEAGPGGYVLVRDPTCRLFGYHGLSDGVGGFSLDHMFGF